MAWRGSWILRLYLFSSSRPCHTYLPHRLVRAHAPNPTSLFPRRRHPDQRLAGVPRGGRPCRLLQRQHAGVHPRQGRHRHLQDDHGAVLRERQRQAGGDFGGVWHSQGHRQTGGEALPRGGAEGVLHAAQAPWRGGVDGGGGGQGPGAVGRRAGDGGGGEAAGTQTRHCPKAVRAGRLHKPSKKKT